jgi:hypothetical protein
MQEITDYGVRRELTRIRSKLALANLDGYGSRLEYLPITTLAMRLAADMWANARNSGLPTSTAHAIDRDVILAAQAVAFYSAIVVATENSAILSRFVTAELWSTIVP